MLLVTMRKKTVDRMMSMMMKPVVVGWVEKQHDASCEPFVVVVMVVVMVMVVVAVERKFSVQMAK